MKKTSEKSEMRAKVMVMTDLRITFVVAARGMELRAWRELRRGIGGVVGQADWRRCAKSDQFPPPPKFH
jgi:hypothetical protein